MNDLAQLSSQAAARDLPFLLTGGHAVISHGFARNTFDLDLVIRQNDRGRWLELAQTMGYVIHHEARAFLQFNAPKAESFPLDLMLVNEATFSKLRCDAVPAPSNAPGVWVVSLMHLLALKCHAIKHGHPGRIVKDVDDVIHLIQNNGLDPNASTIRDLFLKHGTEDLYEKVRRPCPRQ